MASCLFSAETLTPKQQGEAREKNRISVKLSRATLTTSQQHEVRKKNTLARSKARRQQRESLADQHVQEQIHSEYKYACSYIFVFSRAYIFQADTSSTAQHVQEHVHSEYKYTYLYICILQGLHFSSGYQQHTLRITMLILQKKKNSSGMHTVQQQQKPLI